MPARPFVIGGLLLLVLGLVGEFLVFPTMLASDGGEFVNQIRKDDIESGNSTVEIVKYDDYDVGDTVRIVDTIARIQICDYNAGQTCVWLDSIGIGVNDILWFTFNGDLLSEYDRGHKVVITFEIVALNSGETAAGYDTDAGALATDAIAPRYSTQPELAFGGLVVLGLLLLVFGGYSAWKGGGKEEVVSPGARLDDDWGMIAPPAAPAAAPAIAGAAPVAFPPAVAPPATQPAPLATQPTVYPTSTETQLIQCPACQSQLKINDPTRPLNITCPGCQAGMVVR